MPDEQDTGDPTPLTEPDPVSSAAGDGPAADVPATSVDGLLERLDGLPVREHPEVFESVHDQLRATLRDVDPG